MEKLPMCRICLVENVRMYLVVNKNLQELYEKLTDVPFVTEDSRPMLACFICYTKLKQCCQLLRKCLQAEELLAQMMNEDYEPVINRGQLELGSGLTTTPIETISIVDVGQTESIAIKEESPAGERLDDVTAPKEEHLSDELEHFETSYIKIEIPPHQSESDLEDDVPAMEFKTEVEEEQEVSKKKRRASEVEKVIKMVPTPKRKHKTLTIAEKCAILDSLKDGVSGSSLSLKYGVGKSTITDLKKKEQKIRSFVAQTEKGPGLRKTLKLPENLKKTKIDDFMNK